MIYFSCGILSVWAFDLFVFEQSDLCFFDGLKEVVDIHSD